jgi:predicted branched-subunit amino acid permease
VTATLVPHTRLDREAVRDVLPIVVGLVPFAAVIGVTIARSPVVPVWGGLLATPLLLAGSAQLAALTLLDGGAGLVTVLLTVVIVNGRLSLYGAALEPRFRDQPAWFRWVAPHTLVDQTYALATSRSELRAPERFRRYWLTVGLVLGLAWTGAITLVALLGPTIPLDSPLGFAAPAVFVGLLVPRLRDRAARRPALVAAVVALLASPLPSGTGLLLAAAVGIAPALLRPGRPS